MDHDRFETNMIDTVNRNCKAKADIRDEKSREEQEAIGHLRRQKVIKSAIEYVLWAVALISIVVVMSFAYHISFVPAKVAVLASSIFAFIAGVRINTLTIRIARYGGRA